ncbi:TPA: helix-turn-helix domain-containing protein [Legionella feeleii]
MSIQKLKDRAFRNPEVESEYEKLNEEFALIDTLLTMRKKSGLSQEEVASKMGTQKSNVSRLERGAVNPSWKTLQNYAHACGFEISMKVKDLNSERHRT